MLDFLKGARKANDMSFMPQRHIREEGPSPLGVPQRRISSSSSTFESPQKPTRQPPPVAASGGWSNSMLATGIALCCIGLAFLPMRLHFKSGMVADCLRTSEAFQIEIGSIQEQLASSQTALESTNTEKGKLQDQLGSAATRLAQLDSLQATLKGEQRKLVEKYTQLLKDKRAMVTRVQASKAGTKQADTLASQLEGMLQTMHAGVKNFGGDAGANQHGGHRGAGSRHRAS